MALAPLGAADGPLPTENQARGSVQSRPMWVSWDQLQSCVKEEESKSTLQLLLPSQIQCLECYGLLLFTSPGQQNDSMQGLGRVTRTTANMCLLEKVFFHWFRAERTGTEENTHQGGCCCLRTSSHIHSLSPQESSELKVLLALPAVLRSRRETPLCVCRACGGANGFGFVLLGFFNLFMYLVKTPLSLTKKILSVSFSFPSISREVSAH